MSRTGIDLPTVGIGRAGGSVTGGTVVLLPAAERSSAAAPCSALLVDVAGDGEDGVVRREPLVAEARPGRCASIASIDCFDIGRPRGSSSP